MYKKLTKEQERLLNLVCAKAATLGRIWYEKNKDKYADDPYKGWRYLMDKYFKEHNIHQEAIDMMDEPDKKKYMKWFESLDEESKYIQSVGMEDYFTIDEILDWA